jgi:imidazolonepropionase-like amidohydrolase
MATCSGEDTDTPNPYRVPGFALHRELALLVGAGLTPACALKTATWSPAEFLGLADHFGSIEPGKIAGIVLLDADPLASIANTRQIHAVVRRGRLTDAAGLRQLLENVHQAVRHPASR